MSAKSGSEPLLLWSDAESVTQIPAAPLEREGVVKAAVPLVVLAAGATAYGFLDGTGNHPSLQLGGAFVVAGLASAAVLWDWSMLLRHTPEVEVADRALFVRRDRRDIVRIALAFLLVAAALIHFAVIKQHFTDYWLYGAFFVAVGLFELVWALLVIASPSRLLYIASVVVNTLTIAAYVVTRTVGVLVGPLANKTERIGFGDLIATAFEVLLVAGSLLLLGSWGRARVRAAASEASIGTVAVCVTALTVLALFSTVGGPPFVSPAG